MTKIVLMIFRGIIAIFVNSSYIKRKPNTPNISKNVENILKNSLQN